MIFSESAQQKQFIKKIKFLAKEQQELYKHVKKKLKINIWKIKDIVKLEIIVIIQGNKEMVYIAYVIYFFNYYKKVFNVMNIWMSGKNSMKCYDLKKKITVT